MAEINIERKRSSLWPWVIGLLVLAVVVVVTFQYFKSNDDNIANAPIDSAAVMQAPAYAPASTVSSSDTIAGDSSKLDTVPGTTTSSQ